MTTLKFMEPQPLNPKLMTCPYCCSETDRLGVHVEAEERLIGHACGRTFSATKGTIFFGLRYPAWVIVLVLTLLTYGCPVQAIVAAFYLDKPTVALWQAKAGQQGQRGQAEIVCNGRLELGQVQADEICVTVQGGQKVWVTTAMSVFARLFLWGEVSPKRDRPLIERVMVKVRAAAGNLVQPILVAVDGLAAYPKAIRKAFADKLYSGQPSRPSRLTWPELHLVQVVKQRRGKKLVDIPRRLAYGCLERAYTLIAISQMEWGQINTAFVERLNATFRARMPALVRRTRGLAQTTQVWRQSYFGQGRSIISGPSIPVWTRHLLWRLV